MRLRSLFTAMLTGVLLVGSVWAGAALSPITRTGSEPGSTVRETAGQLTGQGARAGTAGLGDCSTLGANEACVGAAKVSLEPQPPTPGEWEHDRATCLPLSLDGFDPEGSVAHAPDVRMPWIENNNCIYMGGYGLGPSNPVLTWDQQYGLWVRSTVYTDAQGDDIVLTIIDAEGYFGDYNKLCGDAEPRCGSHEIAEDLGAELGLDPNGFIIASTHSHTSLDLIGGWGGVPPWYMDQVARSIKDSIRQAFANRVPARLEAGDELARRYNSDRRDLYWAAEDPSINWLRALDRNGAVISTVGVFASHPVNYDESLGLGHGDYPPAFAAETEANQGGGLGMIMQAGLGNMTGGGNWETKGKGLADLLPAPGTGTPVTAPDIKVKRQFWDQPVTNGPLGSLGAGGFFDRPFGGPAAVDAGKASVNRCHSASPLSVHVNVVAAKIGGVFVTSAPGEVFANFTNTIEERAPITSLAIAQANDALGYMPQSIEANLVGQQGTGFIVADHVGYEDAYMIDRCFGDMALQTTLDLLNQI
jgi:hypothetical protein